MGKDKKKKKKNPAPDKNLKKTGSVNTETEEREQMAQKEKSPETAENMMGETTEDTAEMKKDSQTAGEPAETAADPETEESAADAEQAENAGTGDGAVQADEGAGEEDDEARGYFKKKKEKKEKKSEQIAELTDKLQRQMAEFENFRKRTEREKATMYDMGTRDTVEKLLPVVDNFERGLAGAAEDDPFAEGMKMIYKQMMTMLKDLGVTPIDAAGKEFDPNLHNAVMHVDDENFGDNIVAEELQKGYMFKDHVVRHSMVKVAN